MKTVKVTISGSFRKHLAEIRATIREFKQLGVEVLSPAESEAINPGEEFVLLASDDSSDPRVLEQRHLDAIAESQLLFVVNPGGYIGNTVIFEIGFAVACGKPVFCSQPTQDVTISKFVRVASVSETFTIIRRR